MSLLTHAAIAVPDLLAATARFQALFGVAARPPRENEDQGVRLVHLDLGGAMLELMQPTRPDSSIARFLERHPRGGLHHIGLRVDDLEEACALAARQGVHRVGRSGVNVFGRPIAFLDLRDLCGTLVELEQAGPG
jgi:methylmalonyl-CoA/ethylmalonyl-CoA epimerase